MKFFIIFLFTLTGLTHERFFANAEFIEIIRGGLVTSIKRQDSLIINDDEEIYVEITKSFEIMNTEVTQEQWFHVMGNNPSTFKEAHHCKSHHIINGHSLCPDHPVESVSWLDAQRFIHTLNDNRGLKNCHGVIDDPSGCVRLPTEYEWEYAARGFSSDAYLSGSLSTGMEEFSWYFLNSHSQTNPVGLMMPNSLNLFDMFGNVAELTQSQCQNSIILTPYGIEINDPKNGVTRVFKGGHWNSSLNQLRISAKRQCLNVTRKDRKYGLRLVRNL